MSQKKSRKPKKEKVIKRSRVVMTLQQKLEVLDKLEGGMSCSMVGRLYGTNESTIRTIKQNEKAIRDSVRNGTPSSLKVTYYPRNKILEKMESVLSLWIKEQAECGAEVSSVVIRDKAKGLYQSLGEGEECDSFLASKGWFENFKRRYNLNFKSATERVFSPECVLEEEESSLTAVLDQNIDVDRLNELLLKAKELAETAVEMDPVAQRSLKFAEALEDALVPYKQLQNSLKHQNGSENPKSY